MAGNKLRGFLRNVSYTFTSNIIAMFISVITVLVIPKLVGVEAYGYYQLYIFYISYVGVSYMGWCDGIYLREGGKYYSELDKSLYATQFWLLGLFELTVYGIIFIGSMLFMNDVNKHYVIMCTCIVAIAMCLRCFVTFVIQAVARIKEFAIVTISERIIFVVLAVLLIAFGYRQFHLLIAADVVAKFVSLLIGIRYCHEIIFAKLLPLRNVWSEIKENIKVGFQLMLASLCSMLIIGVIRFGVQSHWDIATFGKVSLTLSVSNLIMQAINAIAVVLYPTLRRTNEAQLPRLYSIMRIVLMGLVFGGLMFYYPVQKILTAWLPQYAESLRYAAILFPICAYESKMSMLVNTYCKTLRMENLLMKCNMAALTLSFICIVLSAVVFESVIMAITSILVALMFRCVLSELILSRHIEIHVVKDIVIEIIMTSAFIICNWFFGFAGMIAYAVCYGLYLLIKKADLVDTLKFINSVRG